MPTKRLQIVDSITKQADWNQTDETQKDFIKNKPTIISSVNGELPDESGNVIVSGLPEGATSYQQLVTDGEGNAKWEDRLGYKTDPAPVETVLIEEQTVEFSDPYGTGQPQAVSPVYLELVVGNTYTVWVDGTQYSCVCFESNGYLGLGNQKLSGGTDTGEPFLITNVDGNTLWVLYDATATQAVIKVTGFILETAVVPIPDTYLPTTVPVIQSAQVGQTIVIKSIDENNKPTEWETKNSDFVSYSEQELTEEEQSQARKNIGLADDYVLLIDAVNGYKYVVQMKNGNLVSEMLCTQIVITTFPDKMEYYEGEAFDPTGMIVTAEYPDGTSREIADYTCSDISESPVITITYKLGPTFTTTLRTTPMVFDPEVHLADFNYTANGDGTYTITDWKGTLNGVPSTEIIIPNFSMVVV